MTTPKQAPSQDCPVCGKWLNCRVLSHIKTCEELPSGKELYGEILNGLNMGDLSQKYKVDRRRIKGILVSSDDTPFTNDNTLKIMSIISLPKRGYAAQDGALVTCVCGILVDEPGQTCSWCKLESHGIKSYHDMYNA